MVGDYFMTAFTDDGEPHPVYAIAHLPQDLPFNEAMYTGGSVNLPQHSGRPSSSRARPPR